MLGNIVGAVLGWGVFLYLVWAAWPVLRRHARAVRSLLPRRSGRYTGRRAGRAGVL